MLSILPFDQVPGQRDTERPFKAYSHPPVSLAASASFYSPFAPPSFLGSVGIQAAHSSQQSRRDSSMETRPAPHSYDLGMMDATLLGGRMPLMKNEHIGVKNGQYHMGMHAAQATVAMGYSNGAASMHSAHNGMRLTSDLSTSDMQKATVTSSTMSVGGDDIQRYNMVHSQIPPKKRAMAVPQEMKDDTYWDKRQKNNDSAKRSREARRMKEEQIAMRVVYLEQDNLQLRTEVSLLKSEIEKLRCMLYSN
ncbi:hypothetical protein NP493_305g02020 [Ridgeia piscesae]|uniref:BZIP domain-containing protein n=1 Tax=Ridgeia piscesae TaxID=27915 RepID=A0AAD9NWF9_RIDPI|nr:hypothetical protein NP493_305g02020 [Ridgeia piscesae]